MIASSKWQLLGCNPPGEDEEEWAVTFFEKTLFTPAGLDIYARTEKGLPEDLVRGFFSLERRRRPCFFCDTDIAMHR